MRLYLSLIVMSNKSNGLGIAGFIVGLIGAVCFWIPIYGFIFLLIGFCLSLLGLIVGIFAKRKKGFSIAGLIVSFIFLFIIGAVTYSLFDIKFLKNLGGKKIAEGVIEYDITYPKLDPNNMMVSGLPNKAYLRFKNNNMVNDMSGMMGLISITYISKQSDKSVAQTLTLINKKYVSDIPADKVKSMNDEYIKSVDQGKHTQTIAGFKCKEAIATLKNGETIHAFYTNDIGISNPNWSNPYNKIDGVMMDFEMERYGLAMHLKAKQVLAQKIDDSAFSVSDGDYKKISFDELEKILVELNPSGN